MTIEQRVERMFNQALVPFTALPPAGSVEGMERRISDFDNAVWRASGGLWLPLGGLRPRITYTDAFKRADTSLGTLGGGWTISGDGITRTQVSGGKYTLRPTDPNNYRTVYAAKILPFQPTYLAAKYNWLDNGAPSGINKTIALLMAGTTTLGQVYPSVHVTTASTLTTQVINNVGAFIDLVPVASVAAPLRTLDGTNHMIEVFVFGRALVITRIDGIIITYVYDPVNVMPVTPTQHVMIEHYSGLGSDIKWDLEINEILAGYAY